MFFLVEKAEMRGVFVVRIKFAFEKMGFARNLRAEFLDKNPIPQALSGRDFFTILCNAHSEVRGRVFL